MAENRFEEKIIYKIHQHWIVLFTSTGKYILYFALPISIIIYFFTDFSWIWTCIGFLVVSIFIALYDHYLWQHSWLMIGNQKVTLSVRNGFFSQYAMNIRYRNIRDCAVSKNNIFGYLFKYGTLFIRSSGGNDGDFRCYFVPKVGKVYALVNALSRYNDDERARIMSIDQLYSLHQEREYSHTNEHIERSMTPSEAILTVSRLPGVTHALQISRESRQYIKAHEEKRNEGVIEVLERTHVIGLTYDLLFRDPARPPTAQREDGAIYFPQVAFPEIRGSRVVSASPSRPIHEYLGQFFPYIGDDEGTLLIGWDD